jgi:hypothetical protein
MIVRETPRTVDEAELAGWGGLETHCGVCRMITVVSWPRIRRRSGHRKLAEIKLRLRCSKCRTAPETVALHRTVNHVRGSPSVERLPL